MTALNHYINTGCIFLLAAFLCTACKEETHKDWSKARTEMEQTGQRHLAEAREALKNKNYNVAREKVEMLRKECELALSAREEGILLMDSINLFEAQNLLERAYNIQAQEDSIEISEENLQQKVYFYKRKLEHDKSDK